MSLRYITASHLETNHINSLRFNLCDILYDDYKGTTFFLTHMLAEKKDVLKKLNELIEKHPELLDYKNDSKYWYPYEGVDGNHDLKIYTDYYPNQEGEITYFSQKGQNSMDYCDYLFDPVKLMFLLMCEDIRKMDCNDELAKEIIKINNQLFQIVIEVVGETINYSGYNNLEHMNSFLEKREKSVQEGMNDARFSQEMKEVIKREYDRFNDAISFLDDAFIIANQCALDKKMIIQENKAIKIKI